MEVMDLRDKKGRFVKGNGLGVKKSKKTVERMRKAQLGNVRSLESREKQSRSRIGIRPSLESRLKMSVSIKKAMREGRHPFWKGGIHTPERIKLLNRERYHKRMAAPGSHTSEEWEALKDKFNHECVWCTKQEPEIKLTQDHVVPTSKGGNNYISNIQPMCGPCNTSKGSHEWDFREAYTLERPKGRPVILYKVGKNTPELKEIKEIYK